MAKKKELKEEFVSDARIHIDDDEAIEISVHYDEKEGRKYFELSKGQEVDFITATYIKATDTIDDEAEVFIVNEEGQYFDMRFTLSPAEKLIFKEELITMGLI